MSEHPTANAETQKPTCHLELATACQLDNPKGQALSRNHVAFISLFSSMT
jgi:hypothetical protein